MAGQALLQPYAILLTFTYFTRSPSILPAQFYGCRLGRGAITRGVELHALPSPRMRSDATKRRLPLAALASSVTFYPGGRFLPPGSGPETTGGEGQFSQSPPFASAKDLSDLWHNFSGFLPIFKRFLSPSHPHLIISCTYDTPIFPGCQMIIFALDVS